MNDVVAWLNRFANLLGSVCLAPIALLPGWLSATLVGVLTGVLMLVMFKYTSHQSAIKATRDQIKANLIALSLFKDDVRVGLRAQGRMIANAGKLLLLSLVPMLVMTIPMVLVLGQLALWYQARPLRVGEDAVVTAIVNPSDKDAVKNVVLGATEQFDVTAGPVRVPLKNMVCWQLRAKHAGHHQLSIAAPSQAVVKQVSVGDGFMPTSLKRPAWDWAEMLLHPRELPFAPDASIQSIEIDFPERDSWTSGTDYWIVYWFIVSMLAAFAIKPLVGVNL